MSSINITILDIFLFSMTDKPETNDIRQVSYSQYSVWANCPHQYRLKYVDGLREPQNINLIFGTAMHHAIQEWLNILFNGEKFKSKIFDIETVFKDKLLELFKENVTVDDTNKKSFMCDQETLQEFYLDGCEILRHVKRYHKDFFPTAGYELIGCEIPLEIFVRPTIKFIGYIDIVIREKRTKKTLIFDLKTSRKGWYHEKKDPKKLNQLLLYKKFYSKQFDIPLELIDVKFIILKRKLSENTEWIAKRLSEFEPSHGIVSVNRAGNAFEMFIDSAFDDQGQYAVNNMHATPSEKACRWCIFATQPDLCPDAYRKK